MKYLLFISIAMIFAACSSGKYAYKISYYDGQDHLVKYNLKDKADSTVIQTFLNVHRGIKVCKRKNTYYVETTYVTVMGHGFWYIAPINNRLFHRKKRYDWVYR
jgi:hypothetical protein